MFNDGIIYLPKFGQQKKSSPTSAPTPRKNNKKTSINFRDEGSFFTIPTANTVTFPDRYDLLPEAQNGTTAAQAASLFKSPQNSVAVMGQALQRYTPSFDVKSVKTKLGQLAETASDSIVNGVNRTMDGRDAVQMYNSIKSAVPSISVPDSRSFEKAVNAVGDGIQGMLELKAITSDSINPELQGSQWQFAMEMEKKARQALVEQGICQKWHIMPTRANLKWQSKMSHELADLYVIMKDVVDPKTVLSMKPVWIADREKMVWKLLLDTGMDVDRYLGDESSKYMDTGFEVAQQHGWVKIHDLTRGSVSVEDGEWEEVESS